jgi:hypothetical protein
MATWPRHHRPVTSSAVPNVSSMAEANRSLWSDLNSIGDASPVFPEHPALLRAAVLALPDLRSDQSMDLTGYFHIFVPTRQQADELVARLRAEPDVTYADAQQKWQYPVKFGQTRRVATFAAAACPSAECDPEPGPGTRLPGAGSRRGRCDLRLMPQRRSRTRHQSHRRRERVELQSRGPALSG